MDGEGKIQDRIVKMDNFRGMRSIGKIVNRRVGESYGVKKSVYEKSETIVLQ